MLFGTCPPWIYESADTMTYDLYLVMNIDVPWVDDNQRYLAERRQEFFDLCIQALEKRKRPYIVISGPWEERFTKAVQAVEPLIKAR